ncbi:hypothetical protein QN277_018609 [Acacia crassicarpa]|uniref:Leucine-rich repeat-containing N-terminal plant-type domain-containing protein n=3 Tax=Acacia crassicarpa TaxID=499986 RepID=A0AAE1JWX0_9FABA|nr:hypothetical protein QN277_018609 [Acacia crassicarpa]
MFKQGVVDPSNRISSWSSLQDCCLHWEGVSCDDDRVVRLDLESYNSEILRGEINFASLLSLDFLEVLNLKDNDFERISMPSINNSVATHTHLLPNSSKLSELNLSYNIHLHIDKLHYLLSRLPPLTSLDISGIHLPSATNWAQVLASLPLEELFLYDCNLTSSVLSLEYANFSSLSTLDLGLNDFTYGLPNWLFNLSEQLYYIGLSQCNVRGQLSDFSDFRQLYSLDLSNNKLKGSIPDWIGQLDSLGDLDLSNNSFHGSFPSNLVNFSYLDISFNDLSGTLPKILGRNESIGADRRPEIFLSSNKFKGQLPQVSDTVYALDLADNSFSGPLSSLLCDHSDINSLSYLDLSNNYLTQELPDCWSNWTFLSDIFLGNNQLVGQVPLAMGSSLRYLRALDLQNNGFSGHIPWTFHECTSLLLINLEGNNFSGSIQTWMPQNVSVVILRSNQFSGTIPPQLCTLSKLIVLDLANNKLSGSIPRCLSIITGFSSVLDEWYLRLDINRFHQRETMPLRRYLKIDLHTKGQQLEYQKNLRLLRIIDLSANKLSGEIPVQLFKLTKLNSLNLSNNHLIGDIPNQIGELKDLESLDFSNNHLHGNIPQSMSSLSFLSVLNLSHNNFSGKIPLGTQLQGFDAWSYTGNPELCGPPLQKKCTIPEKPDNIEQVEGNDYDTFLKSLYLGMGVGFAVGFWVVCGSLFLNREWRHTYFRFFDGVIDRIYVVVAIKLQRFL